MDDASAARWVDQASSAADRLRTTATREADQVWSSYQAWYDVAATTAAARELAGVSQEVRQSTTGLFADYLAHLTATIRSQPRLPVPKVVTRPVRNGVDPVLVHSRPAQTYRDVFSLTGDDELAVQRAVERGIRLIEDDLMLAARQAQADTMERLKIGRYRRVLRPELSKDGPCGLCVVASNQIYHRSQLMPIHGRCKCQTMPVFGELGGDGDPGRRINNDDLEAIYTAAGSTGAADLKRTRVQVSQHGELGPVLHVRGQQFTGPEDLAQPVDADLARKRLAKLQDVLAQLEQPGSTAGAEQVAFQRSAIARTARQAA